MKKSYDASGKLIDILRPEITVKKSTETTKFWLEDGQSLMDGLIKSGYYISAVCGGTGRCGKCKVRIISGEVSVTSEDEKFFSEEELKSGWRLSCILYPKEDLTIAFELDDESEFVAVSEYESLQDTGDIRQQLFSDSKYNIAIDIGTTTLAFQLLDKTNGQVMHTLTKVNSQRKFGADVVTRIKASVDGKQNELRECIQADLRGGILELIKTCDVSLKQIDVIVIAGNTTMGHLLMGYDCSSLGVYPFTPVNIDFINGSMEEILGMNGNADVVLLPGISTYVGGDIVSGLYACEFDKSEEVNLLVDLGTNGEMALGNAAKILVTSTAAGPAFEGGNIEWGTGSVAGAICSVKLEHNGSVIDTNIKTILDKIPVGICGTGVVEAVAELLKEDVLDDTGLLDEEYFDDGFPLGKATDGQTIVLTQKDIRELQLAKAAIRAGIETLLIRYGVTKEQVSKVYIAGGFGYSLNTEKAIAVGMIPKEFAAKTQAIGNSSLAGAVKFLREADGREAALAKLVSISEEIGLSLDRDFNEFYMEHMMFKK